jgi:fructose-1-phosphate kinase PfkB-like protein
MILTVCMSPCIDVNVEVDSLNVGKTNVAKRKVMALGGKALNVAIGAKRLGASVYTTGIMYKENGEIFERELRKEGVDFGFVACEGRVRENYKFIDRRAMLTEVNDVGAEVSKENANAVLSKVKELSSNGVDVTVISGSLPRGLKSDFYGELVR